MRCYLLILDQKKMGCYLLVISKRYSIICYSFQVHLLVQIYEPGFIMLVTEIISYIFKYTAK